MANRKKTWFLAPNWDMDPSSIKIGSVISKPDSPQVERSLAVLIKDSNGGPKFLTANPASVDSTQASDFDVQIHESKKVETNQVLDSSHLNTLGVLARFFQFFGFGPTVTFGKDSMGRYEFDEMVTRFFVPSTENLRAVLSHKAVDGYLQRAGQYEWLYIVTGTKIVTGAKVMTRSSKVSKYGVDLSADVSASGIATVEVKGSHDVRGSEVASWINNNPMVFAYQLEQIRRARRSDLVHDEFTKGAMLGHENNLCDLETQGIIVGGMTQQDLSHLDFHPDIDEATGEECFVAHSLKCNTSDASSFS